MLSWTSNGAVERPTTVQIRVQRSYPGRIRAGAPVPTRSMTQEEVLANIKYFTVDSRGPRSIPCKGLVISGVGVVGRQDIPSCVDAARDSGIEWSVLHVGGEDLELLDLGRWTGRVQAVVIPLQPDEVGGGLPAGARVVRACGEHGIRVSVNTVLNARAVDRLAAVARSILRVRPDEVTFTYPFPINGDTGSDPPPIPRTLSALREAIALLRTESIHPRVKGLPACYLGPEASLLGRSSNRWYVDADHQREQAILFFPEVVAFHKEELCRFCRAEQDCDGFFATYLRRPGFPALDPVGDLGASAR